MVEHEADPQGHGDLGNDRDDQRAAELNERGVTVPTAGRGKKREEIVVPDDLRAALDESPAARETFGNEKPATRPTGGGRPPSTT